MKTLRKIEITPIFVEFIPDIMEERKVYITKRYKVAVHKCLCGCGVETVTPLYSDGWNLIEHDEKTVSFTPSIANYQFPCRSHYIITKNIANFV